MRTLSLHTTAPLDELAWPQEKTEITMDSSALEIFTDFELVKPRIIDSDTSAIEAERLMLKAHVRMLMVVDARQHFLGVINLENLNSQEILKKLQAGHAREDLYVLDFMQSRESLRAFDYADLAKASIRNVIDTLKFHGEQHCLVIQSDTHKIRGIISASDIARKLDLPVNISHDSSFVRIFQAVHGMSTH